MEVVDTKHPVWAELSFAAWNARENAVARNTRVGSAVRAIDGQGGLHVHGGCNIEDLWKASSIHAERCAIAAAIAAGHKKISHILVAAEREKFTPCGNCLDFIMQFGGPECVIGFQNLPDSAAVMTYTAGELMPHYPR